MSNEKIKPVLNGTAETMLQCFYARAMHSRNPKNKFHDAKAEELVKKLDYDFSNAKKPGNHRGKGFRVSGVRKDLHDCVLRA